MKKELISLLIKEICNDKTCNKCKYSKTGCYLIPSELRDYIVKICEENDIYEK